VEAAGGEVRFHAGEDLLHIFPLFSTILPEGQEAIELAGEFARSRAPQVAQTAV
jgi:hypothetical protein